MSVRRALDDNALAWWELLRRQPGARVQEADRVVLTDIAFPLCNSVVFPPVGVDVDAVLEPGVDQLWWLGSTPEAAALLRRLDERGLVLDAEGLPGMAMALSELPAPVVPPELDIALVRSADDLAAFARPFGVGFGIAGAALQSLLAAFAAYGLDGDVLHFVGRVEGEPVACASVMLGGGAAGLYDVATLPAARGRGYGAALSATALAAGRERGWRDAILHASPSGLPIYERLGFEVLGTVQTAVTRVPAR